jgi:uncharacterized membrane protein
MQILLVGETWVTHSYHIKGLDSFLQSGYGDGVYWISEALKNGGHEFTHLPSHVAIEHFPDSEQLSRYDVVIFSDIGSNTLLLSPDTAIHSKVTSNRLQMVKDYVLSGGGFAMIGGYMSFQGIEAKARYKGTAIEDILPVRLYSEDDRMEIPEGSEPTVVNASHPILKDLEKHWPIILGYNKVIAKDNSDVLVTVQSEPLVVIGQAGQGRTMAFTTDCAPHWAPPEFLEWSGYSKFWNQAVHWLGKKTNN